MKSQVDSTIWKFKDTSQRQRWAEIQAFLIIIPQIISWNMRGHQWWKHITALLTGLFSDSARETSLGRESTFAFYSFDGMLRFRAVKMWVPEDCFYSKSTFWYHRYGRTCYKCSWNTTPGSYKQVELQTDDWQASSAQTAGWAVVRILQQVITALGIWSAASLNGETGCPAPLSTTDTYYMYSTLELHTHSTAVLAQTLIYIAVTQTTC